MADTQTHATVLAGVAAVGAVAFVIGAALLATEYGGVWAGVTVGGLAVAAVGAIGLYAIGTVEEQEREQRRF